MEEVGWEPDPHDRRPLYLQIAADVQRSILRRNAEQAAIGRTAKEMAAQYRVTDTTMLRALRVLREVGLIELRRGRGVRVLSSAGTCGVASSVHRSLAEAHRAGVSEQDIIAMYRMIANGNPQPPHASGGAACNCCGSRTD